ncbi:hypothetical protein D3C71_1741540 [compost metagenome]
MTDELVSELLRTDLALSYKINDRFSERIVHYRIELIPLQPWHCIIPHLGDDIEVIF